MSSKRKNTPTKIASVDHLNSPTSAAHDPTSDGDSSIGSDLSDSESGLSLNIASSSQLENSETEMPDMDQCNGDQRPPNKKQRLLQSIQQTTAEDGYSSEETTNSELNRSNDLIASSLANNNILTKPMLGLSNRKTMDTVLQRLADGKKDPESNSDVGLLVSSQPIMDGIQAVLNTAESVQDKQKRLSDMINQLQLLQETLANANNKVSYGKGSAFRHHRSTFSS